MKYTILKTTYKEEIIYGQPQEKIIYVKFYNKENKIEFYDKKGKLLIIVENYIDNTLLEVANNIMKGWYNVGTYENNVKKISCDEFNKIFID